MPANTTHNRRGQDLGDLSSAFKSAKVNLNQACAAAMKIIVTLAAKAATKELTPKEMKAIDANKKLIDTIGTLIQKNPSLAAKGAADVGVAGLIPGCNTVDEPTTTPGGYRHAPKPPGA